MKKCDTVKPDMELKNFWRNNERFADLCNAVLFQGRETLKPEDLEELDSDVSGIIFSKENRESILRTRDIVKKIAYGTEFVIVGIENQTQVHYAMPLRVILYDGLGYLKQFEEIKAKRKKSKEAQTGAEFLSEFGKNDKLAPIITLVIYYGNTPWDGPLSLHDMLYEMTEPIKNLVSNHQMKLVQIRNDTEYVFHNEDVKLFFLIARAFFHNDKEMVTKITKETLLKRDLIKAIGKVIKSNELIQYVEKDQKEELDMCEIFEELRAEGKAEGMVLTLRSLNWETSEILKHLIKELGLSEEEGKKFL